MTDTRFRPNSPRVVDETIDGETLIMDMVSGSYYSCTGASATVWLALREGATAGEVSALLVDRYGISAAEAEADTHRFVEALLADELVTPRAEHDVGVVSANGVAHEGPGSYAALQLEKFTDLADIILLDPVHDVSDAGWPRELDD